jgi:hypothetical protein
MRVVTEWLFYSVKQSMLYDFIARVGGPTFCSLGPRIVFPVGYK